MRRWLVGFAAAGLALSACGTQSASSVMASWVKNSSFDANTATLLTDAAHVATSLRDVASTAGQLHAVCAVMLVESEQANSSLPSPDSQATTLLGRAYGQLGAAANICYEAAGSGSKRGRALNELERGVGTLSEGRARVQAVIANS